MQFVALSRRLPGTTPEQLAAHAADEAWAAHQLLAEGIVRSIQMCPDRPGSLVTLDCASLADAQAALARLPMVRAGLIAFDVSRLVPWTGYAALFAPAYAGKAT